MLPGNMLRNLDLRKMTKAKLTTDQLKIEELQTQIAKYKREERVMKLLINQQAKTISKYKNALNRG